VVVEDSAEDFMEEEGASCLVAVTAVATVAAGEVATLPTRETSTKHLYRNNSMTSPRAPVTSTFAYRVQTWTFLSSTHYLSA
jgi:hypothetical protein